MVESKRKRRQDSEQDWSDCSRDSFSAGLSLDLPRKQAKVSSSTDEGDNDGLKEVIQKTTTRRDVKGGTAILKRAKGKGKMTKGEVGGGSFQSMGRKYPWPFTASLGIS
jgi:ATP-dependent RNA helicase DDX54/DBP10